MEQKTHWKKNLDSQYISGEDLKDSLNGLKPELVVTIDRFTDGETFDQNKQAKVIKSALYLKDLNGKNLYKPTLLNKTNAKFLIKEFNSEWMEDWIGKPFVIYAQKDARHGFVVRFKSHVLPTLIKDSENFKNCKIAIQKSGYTVEQIRTKYNVSLELEKLLTDGKDI